MMKRQRPIGPMGTIARDIAGGALVAIAVWSPGWWASEGPLWSDLILGLALFPAAFIAAQWVRTLFTSERLGVADGIASCLNMAIGAGLFAFDYTRDAAALFYGASMLLAAGRGYAGCEVLAISNWLLRRDDQVGCLIFSPIDAVEQRLVRQPPQHARRSET